MADKQIKINVDEDALKMITKACRDRGMTRSEFLVRAGLSFCDANPFSKAEIKTIRKIVKEEIASTNK